MSARRGSRIEGGLPQTAAITPTATYVVTGRPLRMGKHELPVGTEVPGASSWPRVDAWVRARRLRAAAPDETYDHYEDAVLRLSELAEETAA